MDPDPIAAAVERIAAGLVFAYCAALAIILGAGLAWRVWRGITQGRRT